MLTCRVEGFKSPSFQLLLRCQYWGKYNFRLLSAQSCLGQHSVVSSSHTEQRLLAMCLCPSEKTELYGKHCLEQGSCSFLHQGFFTIALPGQGNLQELALSLYLFWDSLHSTRQCKEATAQICEKPLNFACVPKFWCSLCSSKANWASKMNKTEASVIASYLTHLKHSFAGLVSGRYML